VPVVMISPVRSSTQAQASEISEVTWSPVGRVAAVNVPRRASEMVSTAAVRAGT
jgi:hypothetical protein